MNSSVAVIIPFRDRGHDRMRAANLRVVALQWQAFGFAPMIVSDGRDGDAQFNRSAAYNIGARHHPDADVFVFAESDMLLKARQVGTAIRIAREQPGLVVPFNEYRYLSLKDSAQVRSGADASIFTPEWVMPDGRSIGAINVVSRATLEAIGQWDETFEGNWYDDSAMRIAFERCAGKTRWIDGPAWHLYHLPGWSGDHLTDADRAATARNKSRLAMYRQARTPERIRELTRSA